MVLPIFLAEYIKLGLGFGLGGCDTALQRNPALEKPKS